MSGRIMLVDSIASNRIMLAAKLTTAHYQVQGCADVAEAGATLAGEPPDLILIDMSAPADAAVAFCAGLRAHARTALIPVVATGVTADSAGRLAALRAGVDDVLPRPMSDILLLARVRSLLRRRAAMAELDLHDDTRQALRFGDTVEGLAEAQAGFARPGRVTIVTEGAHDTRPAGQPAPGTPLAGLCARIAGGCSVTDTQSVLADSTLPVDVFILDGSAAQGTGLRADAMFRLVAELRSRTASRNCDQLVLLPEGEVVMAAMALDLGASDVVTGPVCAAELDLRVHALLRNKLRADKLRATVRHGLEAAVTDSLTGLYNRRYALPQIARIAENARLTGRDFALMMLDIDHFKQINDTHGHAAGDRVLAEVASRLRGNLRGIDLIARIGGEEFLVAMPDTSDEQARATAERLRRAVNDAPFALTGSPVPAVQTDGTVVLHGTARIGVTVSIGVAIGGRDTQDVGEVDRVMARADTALYAAKTGGRNTVTVSQTAA